MRQAGGGSGGHKILAVVAQPAMLLGILWFYHYFIFSDMNARMSSIEKMMVDSTKSTYTNEFLNLKAPAALPSVLVPEDVSRRNNTITSIYGGSIDKPHLGGFLVDKIDYAGYSPALFNFMIGQVAVKSVVDVGCGVGYSLKYFHDRGAKSLCVEGSHHAVLNSKLPKDIVVEHDFTRGPWWPTDTFDAAWSVEFLEHVGRQHMENYLPILKKSALIFATSSMWGGWHHVEVKPMWWWISRFQARGFVYLPEFSEVCRQMTEVNKSIHFEGQHMRSRLMVFVNPSVASLPQHKHLFGGHGCYRGVWDTLDGGAPCEGPDAVPPEYLSLLECYRYAMGVPPHHQNEGWAKMMFKCGKDHASIQRKLRH